MPVRVVEVITVMTSLRIDETLSMRAGFNTVGVEY